MSQIAYRQIALIFCCANRFLADFSSVIFSTFIAQLRPGGGCDLQHFCRFIKSIRDFAAPSLRLRESGYVIPVCHRILKDREPDKVCEVTTFAFQQLTPLAARERLYRRFPATQTSSSSPDRARVSWSPREEIALLRIVVETAGLHLFSPTFDFLPRFFPPL
jgi:hypothetical protein